MKVGDYVRCNNELDKQKHGNVYRLASVNGGGEVRLEGVSGSFGQSWFDPVKVAVHCKTKDEWDRVCEEHTCTASWSGVNGVCSGGKRNIGLRVDVKDGGWGTLAYFGRNGFHIISAQEYLGEEGMTETERKFGEKNPSTSAICKECGENYGRHSGCDPDATCRKKTKQTNNIKGEDKMNQDILEEFGDEKGTTLMNVSKHLSEAMRNRIFNKAYHKEIVKACNDEAKRLEEENKD